MRGVKMDFEEGKITVEDGYQVWFRRNGGGGVPLLVLHGGPGAGHDYLEPLEALGRDRPVIFYDQLGCGRSDQPDEPSRWVIDRFVTEVEMVREALALDTIHLLGQSWGGWLAIEYMLTQPQGVKSLILASTSASVPQFVAEAEQLRKELPPEVYQTMVRYEASGEFDNPAYEAATLEFYKRHVCRLEEWPDPLLRTVENLTGNQVYETMNGPNEFFVIGNLKDWNRIDRLAEIKQPTLITVGRYDELTPACAETLHQGIHKSRIVVFENSSHSAHIEESERFLQTVSDFLDEVEMAE
jgi:proline-specific peptidase